MPALKGINVSNMINAILEPTIHLIIVLPIILLTLKSKKKESLKILLAFSIFFLLNSTLLFLPLKFEELRIIGGNWNWNGKIFAILGSIIFLLLYRKFELKDYHLTFNQNKEFLKEGVIIISVLLIIQTVLGLIYKSPKEWNAETFLFQLTMPGIDEEIAFRGIMLGLLTKILKPTSKTLFHPAIIITSLLFGMAHGLFLNESYELTFNSYPFFTTLIHGMIWGFVTIKSGSILLALVSHNIGNVTNQLISMNK